MIFNDIALRKPILTADGSSTLKLLCYNEQFHSVHGAIAESKHIYIDAGFRCLPKKQTTRILEIGLGTGLNALLTMQCAANSDIYYHGIEAYPLSLAEALSLNYVEMTDSRFSAAYRLIHQSLPDEWVNICNGFSLKKSIARIEAIQLEDLHYDLVYFDAFSPEIQPELWSEKIFEKIWQSMEKGGIMVTYCAKGYVKRLLTRVGFQLFSLSGPAGKREISQCVKF